MNAVKEEMKLPKKDVDELKSSLTFSQKDIDDVKQKCYKIDERLRIGSIEYNGARLWDMITLHIREASSPSVLKDDLKKYFLTQYNST